MWKLADFGITGPASTAGIPTTSAKGTPCYRAPELLQEKKFTPKVDLWALGCILYECVTGSKKFPQEYHVPAYSDDMFQFRLPWSSVIWNDFFSSGLKDLLRKDQAQRPTAADTLELLGSYKHILISPFAESVFDCVAHPSYQEWNQLRQTYPNDIEWLHEIAKSYQSLGEERIANDILEQMVQLYLDSVERLSEGRSTTYPPERDEFDKVSAIFSDILDYLPESLLAWICFEIASYLTAGQNPDWHSAIRMCEQAMTKSPTDPIIPMLLSNLQARKGEYERAIETEAVFRKKFARISLINLETAFVGFFFHVRPFNNAHFSDITAFLRL